MTPDPTMRPNKATELLAGVPALHRFLFVATLAVFGVTTVLGFGGWTLGAFEGTGMTREVATLVAGAVCLMDLIVGRWLARAWVRTARRGDASLEELAAALSPGGLVGMFLATAGVVTAGLFVVVGGSIWPLVFIELFGLHTIWGLRPDAARIELLMQRSAAGRAS